jgi:hypothetical protein
VFTAAPPAPPIIPPRVVPIAPCVIFLSKKLASSSRNKVSVFSGVYPTDETAPPLIAPYFAKSDKFLAFLPLEIHPTIGT